MFKKNKSESQELDAVCKYCENATELCDENSVLCKKHGVVACDHSCKKFLYDPLKRRPNRAKLPEIESLEDLGL
ncbi:MAG: hypothetical protein PUB34_02405 [Clostridia bacterium]|nr:hypothetical protein [Clostridia bacterium]